MLVIRNDQLRMFDLLSQERYVTKLCHHLVGMFPDRTDAWDDETLRALATQAVERAAGYGIVTERGVATFAELMVVFGERFDLEPEGAWARDVLTRPGLDGAGKALVLRVLARGRVDPADAEVFGTEEPEEDGQ
jgi:hypothetical protein